MHDNSIFYQNGYPSIIKKARAVGCSRAQGTLLWLSLIAKYNCVRPYRPPIFRDQ